MKKFIMIIASMFLVIMIGGCAGKSARTKAGPELPPGTLNAVEVTALFSGKTVESVLDKTGRVSLTYYKPNGELLQMQKGKMRSGKWKVREDGRICLAFPGEDRQCRIIVREGTVYRKYIVKLDGNHIPVVTYKSFLEGNLIEK